jgi:hypothetical protein
MLYAANAFIFVCFSHLGGMARLMCRLCSPNWMLKDLVLLNYIKLFGTCYGQVANPDQLKTVNHCISIDAEVCMAKSLTGLYQLCRERGSRGNLMTEVLKVLRYFSIMSERCVTVPRRRMGTFCVID